MTDANAQDNHTDTLWASHIGSHRLSALGELRALRKLQEENTVSWRVLYMMYYRTKVWGALRQKVLKRDNRTCVMCGSQKFLTVDHIKYPKRIGGELMRELQTLCWLCHKNKTKRSDMGAHGFEEKFRVNVSLDQPLHSVLRR